jgi:glyoxylase-like metal-dependent hydrolase (beta-lactamase superfamily II)
MLTIPKLTTPFHIERGTVLPILREVRRSGQTPQVPWARPGVPGYLPGVKIGDFEIHLLVAGGWHGDGGATFGVVPKVLWEVQKPADERNLIRCACVAAVVRHRGRVIVCETGIGSKLDERRARQMGVWEPEALLTALGRLGVRPEEVDLVTSSHLHWDHAGGFTRRSANGGLELTFPRARHLVQRSEWDFALRPDPRSRAGYYRDDLLPVAEAGLVEFVEGEVEPVPGLVLRQTGGHTPGHQLVIFRASEDLSCVLTGDLVGMRPHLRVPWIPAADLDVLRTIEEKTRLLEEAANHRWLLVLAHETDQPAGFVDASGSWTPETRLSP